MRGKDTGTTRTVNQTRWSPDKSDELEGQLEPQGLKAAKDKYRELPAKNAKIGPPVFARSLDEGESVSGGHVLHKEEKPDGVTYIRTTANKVLVADNTQANHLNPDPTTGKLIAGELKPRAGTTHDGSNNLTNGTGSRRNSLGG